MFHFDVPGQVAKGGMMDFGEWQAVRDDGLPQPFILVGNDVRGVEQPLFGQSGQS